MKRGQFTCWCLFAAFCSGCGTIANQGYDARPYGGVVWDFEMATGNTGSCMGFPIPCMILDVPFSLVGDTLSLPFNAHNKRMERKYQEEIKRNPLDPNPLDGWIYNYVGNTNAALEKDFEAYIQSLPSDQKKQTRYVNWFKNGTDNDAVQITIATHWMYSRNIPSWKHVLFYDQSHTRTHVMKYEKGHLCP